ncbi:MAG: alpha/beta hydrolase [Verrucomicrobia bacterium]|nr:alpha/beta hydrolase [Verrucomicrobiota bacterium]
MPRRARAPAPLPPNYQSSARISAEELSRSLRVQKSAYRVERVTMAYRDGELSHTNVVDWYLPRAPQSGRPVPAIAILPILGGGKYALEEHFAALFSRHGYAAALAHRDKELGRDIRSPEDVDRLLQNMVLETRSLIDWMKRQPGVDRSRLGLFGVSFGAIKAALVLPFSDDIRAAVLGLVGGDLGYIFTHTTERGLAKRCQRLLEKHQLTPEEGERTLNALITYDPLKLAPSVDPGKVTMVLATRDTVVPYEKGLELWKAMGKPRLMKVWAGHYSALLFLPCIDSVVLDFLDEKFREPSIERARLDERSDHRSAIRGGPGVSPALE